MPSTSKAQKNLMAAAAHNPKFAKKAGVPVSVAKEFNVADKGKTFKSGGSMANLKKPLKGKDVEGAKPKTKKMAIRAEQGMAKGGVTRADGCVTKGHTKGKIV